MLCSNFIKNQLENNKSEETCLRYAMIPSAELHKPILVEIETIAERGRLYIRLYDIDTMGVLDKTKQFLDNPFNSESLFNSLMSAKMVDADDSMPPRPICTVDSTIMSGKVLIEDIFTREDYRRQGLASSILKLLQDYYMRHPKLLNEAPSGFNSSHRYMYTVKGQARGNLKYKTRFEHKTGAFGELLSDIKAKILNRGSEEAFDHFLLKNHFNCERFPYQTPSRAMRSRDILTDEIINEETAGSMIQLFGNAIELTPEMLDGDYTVFER